MRIEARFVMTITVALMTIPASGQVGGSPDPLFDDNTIMSLTISGPLGTLVRERPKEEYLAGDLEYQDAAGNKIKLDLDIRARGNFRHEHCDFPPVLLNLKRRQTEGTVFDHQNKLKLVIQCERSERYEQAVLREYLAYRVFNAVTGKSFRVRLLSLTHVNLENPKDNLPRYAFLIEHKNRLGERFGLEALDIERTSVSSLDAAHLNLTSVFHFLVGNTDFSPIAGAPGDKCCHNHVLFGEGDRPHWSVPYDFDQTGFVDAPYADPDPRFNIRSVRQRVYRGRCVNNEYIPGSIQKFVDQKNEIYARVLEQEGLNPKVRDVLVEYIDDFYEVISDPRDVERQFVESCI